MGHPKKDAGFEAVTIASAVEVLLITGGQKIDQKNFGAIFTK